MHVRPAVLPAVIISVSQNVDGEWRGELERTQGEPLLLCGFGDVRRKEKDMRPHGLYVSTSLHRVRHTSVNTTFCNSNYNPCISSGVQRE